MATKVKHFDSLAVVLDDFDIWGGKTSLSESDFRLGEGGELPPASIASLGNKKIIDSSHLRGFHRLKTQCRRLLLRHGVPFLNGVAIPVDKVDSITRQLDGIAGEFELLKQEFLANYDQAVAEWVQSHPEYQEVIARGALSRKDVQSRLKFEYQVFSVQAHNDSHAQKLNDKVEGLGHDLLNEVAQTASKMYDNHFAGRSRCGRRAYSLLSQLREKVSGLSFLNGHLMPLVGMMDAALQLFVGMQKGDYVEAPDFWQVSSTVLILSQRKTIEQYANGEIGIDTAQDELKLDVGDVSQTNGASATSTRDVPDEQPAGPDTEQSQSDKDTDFDTSSEPASDIDAFFSRHAVEPDTESDSSRQGNDAKADEQVTDQDQTESHDDKAGQTTPASTDFSFDDEPVFF